MLNDLQPVERKLDTRLAAAHNYLKRRHIAACSRHSKLVYATAENGSRVLTAWRNARIKAS
jgi:hypothetical protein